MSAAPGRWARAAAPWLLAGLCLAGAGSLHAQDASSACGSDDATAALQGGVHDRLSKVPLPGAAVTAISLRRGS